MKLTKRFALSALVCSQVALMSGCDNTDDEESSTTIGLPEGLHLSLLNATSGAYYGFDTSSEDLTNLNELAQSSADSSIQNLEITDTATIGHFFHWPDFRESDDEALLDEKYLLMLPTYEVGSEIDSEEFEQLAHFHDDQLAAHSSEEFADPEEGSDKANALERLNAFVLEQNELEEEVAEVLPEGQNLCRAYVDPYVKFELEHEEEHEGEEEAADEATEEDEAHDHGELVHFALTETGRMYFFEEGESGLEESQGFVSLDDVSTIADCNRTTVARASEDGVLVFIPDTQLLYLVDSHDADYHQHSKWEIADILPEGVTADMVAVLGEGDEHDHE